MTIRTIRPAFTPYKPGDTITVLTTADDGGTALMVLPVERCVRLASSEFDAKWRVTARRPNGTLFDATVNRDGHDLHGYVTPGRV